MNNTLTDAEKLKRQRLVLAIGIIVIASLTFVLGRITGYNKGFNKRVGWE